MHDLDSWLSYLEDSSKTAKAIGLERVTQVANKLQLLPFPHFTITVAGTNGKGSNVALLEQVLLSAGNKVATFTSPHLLIYNERIRINGKNIDDESLCQAFAIIENARDNTPLNYFEFSTLAALYLFKKIKLDIVILEVGMGGRFDATNIVDTDLAIISTIALDHMQHLGSTREAIGFEKAGIIRKNKPVVCGDFAVPDSIRKQAEKLSAPLYCVNEMYSYETTTENIWSWQSDNQSYKNLPVPTIALQNAACAIQALNLLPKKFKITEETLIDGLKKVFVPARLQIFDKNIELIFDVAHNPAAGEWLADNLKKLPTCNKTFAVVGMLTDKDQENTLKALIKIIDHWATTNLDLPRGENGEELAAILKKLGANRVESHANPVEAFQAVRQQATTKDRIVIFGSFKTVAQIIKLAL